MLVKCFLFLFFVQHYLTDWLIGWWQFIQRIYFNTYTIHISLFCTVTKKCTIISQIITLLLLHYRFILGELVINALPSYKSISNATVRNTKSRCFTQVLCKYIPGQHDSNINIQIVYTATTQTDFMRIAATK
jgi:hypothetical protein